MPVPAWIPLLLAAAPAAWLGEHGRAPAAFLLDELERHPIVIVGEGHWSTPDVELVASLAGELRSRGATLAIEWVRAADQERLDRLVSAEAWDAPLATELLRRAEWPYREYRDLLQAAWRARLRLLALGPPADWRAELLPLGITYDSFMADRVAAEAEAGRRLLVYCGMHHAFTRYAQAELDLAGHATGYVDRMGNRLWRRFGDRVFTVALHRPMSCGPVERPTACLPLGGAIDCAAEALGAPAIGFEVAGSPFAELRFAPDCLYARGHPAARLVDYADGYVFIAPVERLGLVDLIPLAEYAPDDAGLAELARRNPFTDEENVTIERLRAIWETEAARRVRPLDARGWGRLAAWRSACEAIHGPAE